MGICIIMMIWVSCSPTQRPNEQNEKSINSSKKEIINSSYEIPFRITTTKTEFDTLGIEFIFWTGTKKHLLDTLSRMGITISSWPKTNKDWDALYPKIHQSLWLPRVFMLYPDEYFIWNGNRTNVFTSEKRDYPTSKILLIGDKESYDDRGSYLFFTKEMYILVF